MNKILKYIISIAIIIVLFNLNNIFFGIGKFLHDNKHYKTAESYLQYAYNLKPNNPDIRYYYIHTITQLSPTYERQKEICNFAYGEIEDSAQHIAKDKLTDWKRAIKQQFGTNYIEQAPMDSKILRWDKLSFPLSIYIDENDLNIPDYYITSISKAFNQWDKSIDFISFVTSQDKKNADILIQFKQLPDNVCSNNECRYVLGFTTPTIKGNDLKGMTIVLYDKNPTGNPYSDKEIYNTILHELGHALGIMGHSYSAEDLMYQKAQEQYSIWAKYRSEIQYLTGSDVNTINLLYKLTPDITNSRKENPDELIYAPVILGSQKDLANRKLKEALSYIKTAPEISVGYINLANAYSELEEHNKAIDALNKALDLSTSDDERYIIYYNFALIYSKIKHKDTALKYAELAKNINSSEDIIELISIINARG